MRRTILALVSLLASTVMASTLTLTWDVPNERMNGDPLLPEELSHYVLRCQLQDGQNNPTELQFPATSDGGIFEGQLSDVLPEYGVYDCSLAVVDNWGLSSDYVEVQNGPVPYLPDRPGAPTSVLILRE